MLNIMDSLYAAPTHMAGFHHTLPLYILELRFSAALAQSALQCAVPVVLRSLRSITRLVRKGRFSASLLTRSGVKRPLFFWSWGPPPSAKSRCFSASLLTRNGVKRPLLLESFREIDSRSWGPPLLAAAVGYYR